MEDADHGRVLNLVRRAVVTSPELESREIHQLAIQRYPWVEEPNVRQFSARFVRRARREAGPATSQRSVAAAGISRMEEVRIKCTRKTPAVEGPRTEEPAERRPDPPVAVSADSGPCRPPIPEEADH
jgi:hypothetical protein